MGEVQCTQLSDTSEIKLTNDFFLNFPGMLSTKHCFEKKAINRSPCLLRDVMSQTYSICACTNVLVLIMCVIHRFKLHFAVAGCIVLGKDLTGRKCRAYGTISYKICGKITPFTVRTLEP